MAVSGFKNRGLVYGFNVYRLQASSAPVFGQYEPHFTAVETQGGNRRTRSERTAKCQRPSLGGGPRRNSTTSPAIHAASAAAPNTYAAGARVDSRASSMATWRPSPRARSTTPLGLFVQG